MSLIATLFTKSCVDGVPAAGGDWAKATEAKSPHPAAITRALFMRHSLGRRLDAAWPSNVGVHRWFPGLVSSADFSAAASSAWLEAQFTSA
jgi:hypothetical protein